MLAQKVYFRSGHSTLFTVRNNFALGSLKKKTRTSRYYTSTYFQTIDILIFISEVNKYVEKEELKSNQKALDRRCNHSRTLVESSVLMETFHFRNMNQLIEWFKKFREKIIPSQKERKHDKKIEKWPKRLL